MTTIEDVHDARSRFEGRIATTPLLRSNSFSRISNRDVYVKAENMQRAGSFKIRGALNVVTRLAGHPLEASGRFAKFKVQVPDEPGRLAEVLKTVASSGGNVVQTAHHREGFGLPFGTVEIDVSVETRDAAHADQIRSLLAPYLAT